MVNIAYPLIQVPIGSNTHVVMHTCELTHLNTQGYYTLLIIITPHYFSFILFWMFGPLLIVLKGEPEKCPL